MNFRDFLHPKYWTTWLAYFVVRSLLVLPLPIWQRIGIFLGHISYHCAKKRRHITEINIKMAFPNLPAQKQQQLVKKTLINTTLGVLESFYSWWGKDSDLKPRSEVRNLDTLLQAKAKGGVIIMGAHFTTLDLSGRVMAINQKVDIVYKKQRNKLFNAIMHRYRSPHYNEMIEKKDMRSMVKRLKQGEIVWYAPDQDFGRKGAVFAPFFGIETANLSNIGKLVKLTGASVVFFSHFREGFGKKTRFVGHVSPLFENGVSDNEQENAAIFNAALEKSLKDHHPSQYFWVHKRFKTRPIPGTANPYK